MGTGPSSKNVLYQTEECVGEFIERFHKQKKERARDAKYRLMEQHLDMFPAYLDDLDEFCENHLFHRSIVYLTKLEKGKRWGRCMHCGREFLLDRSVKPGSEGTCPKCGFPIRFRGEWASKPIVEKAKICIPSRVDGQLLLRYTDVRRIISPDKREPEFDYSDFFLNIVGRKPTPTGGEVIRTTGADGEGSKTARRATVIPMCTRKICRRFLVSDTVMLTCRLV